MLNNSITIISIDSMNKIVFISAVTILISLSSIYHISYNFFVLGEIIKMQGFMLATPYPGFLLVLIMFFAIIIFFALNMPKFF